MGADELQQAENRAKMWALTTLGLTAGIWDMVEDSATSLSPMIGEQILVMAQKFFGVKLEGEGPEKIMIDLGRVFVEGFGLCSAVNIELKNKAVVAILKDSVGIPELKGLQAHGVTKFFSHPFVCAGMAALARTGVKTRSEFEFDPNGKDCIVTFNYL